MAELDKPKNPESSTQKEAEIQQESREERLHQAEQVSPASESIKANSWRPSKLLTLERETPGTLKSYYLKENADKSLTVNFQENKDSYWNIGAGDMLDIKVREITVITSKGETLKGYRAPSPENPNPDKPGYYMSPQGGRYLPVFTGDQIQIDKVATEEEMTTLSKQLSEQTGVEGQTLTSLEESLFKTRIEDFKKKEKEDEVTNIASDLIDEARTSNPSANWREILQIAKNLAEQEGMEITDSSQREGFEMAAERLESMREVAAIETNFDYFRYKREIAAIESGSKGYRARNDSAARARGVSSMKHAFGKYQFIASTLLDYGVDLRNENGSGLDENKIQAFLNNPSLQEKIMDQYSMKNLRELQGLGRIAYLRGKNVLQKLWRNGYTTGQALAATHLGGLGKIRANGTIAGMTDYFGTSGHSYMSRIS